MTTSYQPWATIAAHENLNLMKSGDREKAMSRLDESLAISSELGMRPLMERVL